MKRTIFIFLLFIYAFASSKAQYCTIDNTLIIEAQNLNENYIAKKINEVKPDFNENQIAELKLLVSKCNNEIENQISLLKNELQSVSIDKQELLKVKDIRKIKEQITEKEKSRDEINISIKKDLQNVSYKGLFVSIVKNIDPYNDSKELLSPRADALISPDAIKNLNGTFISSLTEVKDAVTIADYIKSVVSGEMLVEKPLINKINPKNRTYIYLVKVVVSPLKNPVKTINSYTPASTGDHVVVDAMTDISYKDKLIKFGINIDLINEIEMEVNAASGTIITENDLENRREKDILSNGSKNLQQINIEIDRLKNQWLECSSKLKSTIENKTNIKFDNNNSDASINAAISYFDTKISELKKQILAQKENEFLFSYDKPVPFEGKATTDIAKKALDICGQLRSTYSNLSKFMEVVEVENTVVTNYQSGYSKDLYRTIDKVWLFPVAGEYDNFNLTVIAKFKITELSPIIKDSIVKKIIQPRNINESKQSNTNIHVVQKGETLFKIASHYNTTVAVLKNINQGLTDSIFVGQQIKISLEQQKTKTENICPVDQQQIRDDYGFWLEKKMIRWQEFKPKSITLTSIDLKIQKVGYPGNLIVEIKDQDKILLGSETINESDIQSSGWKNIQFSQEINLDPDRKYRIYVYSNMNSPDPNNRYFWRGSKSSNYNSGCYNDVSNSYDNYDYAFITYGCP